MVGGEAKVASVAAVFGLDGNLLDAWPGSLRQVTFAHCIRCCDADIAKDEVALGSDSRLDVTQQPQISAGGVENRSLIRPRLRNETSFPWNRVLSHIRRSWPEARWQQKSKVNFAEWSIPCPPASVLPERRSELY